MSLSQILQPFSVGIDLVDGAVDQPDRHLVRRAADMRGYYADERALEHLISGQQNPLHYEVFEKNIPEEPGHLLLCISKLQPGVVGQEFYMTKGHYHARNGTAEVYLCLCGRGYMLMKTAEGKCVAETLARGRIVYVPPYWAHRSINTGDVPLVSYCVYPAEAGHNYGDIVTEGFPRRIFRIDGKEVIKPWPPA
jgi:glucose-6-phosphate isomerase